MLHPNLESHLTPQGPTKGQYMAPCKLFGDDYNRFKVKSPKVGYCGIICCYTMFLVIYSKILMFFKSHLIPQGPKQGQYMAPCKHFGDDYNRFQG